MSKRPTDKQPPRERYVSKAALEAIGLPEHVRLTEVEYDRVMIALGYAGKQADDERLRSLYAVLGLDFPDDIDSLFCPGLRDDLWSTCLQLVRVYREVAELLTSGKLTEKVKRELDEKNATIRQLARLVTQREEKAKKAKLDLDSRACGLLVVHPGWSDAKIARELGCYRTSLYRLPQFKTARKVQEEAKRGNLRRGHFDEKTGAAVPYVEDDSDETDGRD